MKTYRVSYSISTYCVVDVQATDSHTAMQQVGKAWAESKQKNASVVLLEVGNNRDVVDDLNLTCVNVWESNNN